MKRAPILIAVSLALAVSLGLAGTPADAGGMHGGAGVGGPIVSLEGPVGTRPFVSAGVIKDPIVPHGFFSLPPVPPRRFEGGQRRFPRGFAPVAVYAPPVIVDVAPPGLYGGPGYDDPGYYPSPDDSPAGYNQPAAYGPPMGYGQSTIYAQPVDRTAPPPPPSGPNVVQYPMGRYELRGDGMSTPYTWVWIPNPPPPPPPGPPPAGPFSGDPSMARRSQLYRWTDDQGVMHLTDRLEGVPPQYRAVAKQAPPS